MPNTSVSQKDLEKCLNLFRYTGFSHLNQKTEQAFESHILSNRKIICLYDEILAEIGNVKYYTDPVGDIVIEPGIIQGARKFKWGHRFMILPRDIPLDQDLIYSLVDDGFNNGFPIGFITNDIERRKQVIDLGTLVKGDFSDLVLIGNGQIRLYEIPKELPIYAPGTFQLRN